jgi:hypothetical protein
MEMSTVSECESLYRGLLSLLERPMSEMFDMSLYYVRGLHSTKNCDDIINLRYIRTMMKYQLREHHNKSWERIISYKSIPSDKEYADFIVLNDRKNHIKILRRGLLELRIKQLCDLH